MRLTVVIPHHHRRELLAASLAAVAGHRVVVVDDSVQGGVVAPGARVVRGPGGEGFARAANRGLDAAQADGATHALLLNDDAAPAPGCVSALVAAWGPEVGAVGPALVRPDGTVESAGIDVRWWGRVRARSQAPRAVAPVDGLSGACLLMSAADRFDVSFVHGMEDLELCQRLRRRGLRCLVVPGARCLHHGGGSLDRASPTAQRHAVSGHLRLLGGGARSGPVLALASAQVAREGGGSGRWRAILAGWTDWRGR